MAVLLATGTYTVTRYALVYDEQGTGRKRGDVAAGPLEAAGRIRHNAQGVDLALDPGCWPAVEPADGVLVEVAGPDPWGAPQVYVVRSATMRRGQHPQLRTLDYVQGYAERADRYSPA